MACVQTQICQILITGLTELTNTRYNIYPQDEERNQCKLEPYQQFPCTNTAPSKNIPTSVHRLRPGDIKVARRCLGSFRAKGLRPQLKLRSLPGQIGPHPYVLSEDLRGDYLDQIR